MITIKPNTASRIPMEYASPRNTGHAPPRQGRNICWALARDNVHASANRNPKKNNSLMETESKPRTVIGRPVAEAMTISQAFLDLMQSKGGGTPDEGVLEDAVAFAGVSKYPARIKCALLGWMAWKDATAQALEEER